LLINRKHSLGIRVRAQRIFWQFPAVATRAIMPVLGNKMNKIRLITGFVCE
jgi:hypothetical protein